MIQVNKKDAEAFLYKLESLISTTSCFPKLQSQVQLLQGIQDDARKLLGKDIPSELDKLINGFKVGDKVEIIQIPGGRCPDFNLPRSGEIVETDLPSKMSLRVRDQGGLHWWCASKDLKLNQKS